MIVVSKKRIRIILMGIMIGVFAFSFQIGEKEINPNNEAISNNEKNITVSSTPASGKVVILDAGHGKPDEGAESSHGTTEAETNLKIALKVQNLLEQSGSTVILTRSDENGIYDVDKTTLKQKKISDIHNRVKIGNESSADIFVSIHLNKIPQEQYWGWQCFYKQGNEASTKLAKLLQSNLNEAVQKDNKRVAMKLDNVYIIKKIEIPTSIVECGFLSNQEEEKLLLDDNYQDKLAWGIYSGIMEYFKN